MMPTLCFNLRAVVATSGFVLLHALTQYQNWRNSGHNINKHCLNKKTVYSFS